MLVVNVRNEGESVEHCYFFLILAQHLEKCIKLCLLRVTLLQLATSW